MTRALVTGANGQDGSYLVESLLAAGTEVHALLLPDDAQASGNSTDVVVHTGDISDVEATRRLVLDLAPDDVYNLAALSSVEQSWKRPDLSASVNGTGAVGLLESAHQVQERLGREVRFVQASSAEIFGEPTESPQTELTAIRPVNPYGASKAFAHLMVGVYRERGLRASSLILYNHESPRRPRHFVTRKITSSVAAISRGRADRLTLGNLDARRDWGWAPDFVESMVLAARAESSGDYVIATGVAHSVRDLVATAFAHVGIADYAPFLDVDASLTRPTDAAELVGDAGKARRVLGWHPTHSFADTVGAMVEADLSSLTSTTLDRQ